MANKVNLIQEDGREITNVIELVLNAFAPTHLPSPATGVRVCMLKNDQNDYNDYPPTQFAFQTIASAVE